LDDLYIKGTRKTPAVTLDVSGKIKIEGRCIPEDASLFFNEILNWIDDYIASNPPKTEVDIAFEYLNSGTSKFILQILKKLSDFSRNGMELTINWYYEEGDDDIMERGEYYSSILDAKINYIETE
jgi:hypothetical protein